ncbi:very-long-chain aldehyde decarbonylase CER3-like [Daucus carota subsp. sativus]|uniref:very-long-chain aldehyde decarbonylase CER3-like n=1 Tax=Daucus carota subsp. sativus TaxID=79200 RepID=UPI0030830331
MLEAESKCNPGKVDAPLFAWPWKSLGSYKYLLYGLLFAEFLYSTYWEERQGHECDWCMHILIICMLRSLIHQLWSSYDGMLFLNHDRRLSQSGINFKQIDNERHWDNFIILQAIVASVLCLSFPTLTELPIWDTRGNICCYHMSQLSFNVTTGYTIALQCLIPLQLDFRHTWNILYSVCLGHSNIEVVPHRIFHLLPPLKYLIYTPTYHRIHHVDMGSHFCLFMPFFDVLGNTIDERYWNLHKETSSGAGARGRIPDFVFLAHGLEVASSVHVPFIFRSFSSNPFPKKVFLLLLWPFSLVVALTIWAFSCEFLQA